MLVSCGLILLALLKQNATGGYSSFGAHQRKGNALEQVDKHRGVNAGNSFPAWLGEHGQPSMPQRNS